MDTFVQSSLSEGMSNTILEAMATGIPVVATRVGGNPEMVEEGESGWLFKPGDVEHLSRLLLKLASHPELRQKSGDAARRRVRDGFSNESMLENYRQLYLELVHKRGADAKRTPAQTSLRPARSEHE
jgi:glycosyltransferase involved in cell wall biosynthesis